MEIYYNLEISPLPHLLSNLSKITGFTGTRPRYISQGFFDLSLLECLISQGCYKKSFTGLRRKAMQIQFLFGI